MPSHMLNRLAAAIALVLAAPSAPAHSGSHASVHDTVAGILERVKASPTWHKQARFTRGRVESLLAREEREVLGSAHILFHVNQPCRVTVFQDRSLGNEPFWLRDAAWQRTADTLKVGDATFQAWQRDFPAGEIGLGVNSLSGGGRHYFVAVDPAGGEPLQIDDLYPGQLRTTNFVAGALPWIDRTDVLPALPPFLEGTTLIQTLHARRDDGRLVGRVQWTGKPAGTRPDHLVLTWSDDPRTTQTLQWRTSRKTPGGAVLYIESANAQLPADAWRRVEAVTSVLTCESTANDPVVHRHTARLTGLAPGTSYAYRVGTGGVRGWTEPRQFTTAPAGPESFSFIYMGDAQNGLDAWGRLVRGAHRERPDAAFYLMAGDLVNRGAERDDWDDFFANARGVFDHRPLVPVLGNHECQGGRPRLYLEQFALMTNGPAALEAERAYAFEYGNALFVILDSNEDPLKQTDWLDATLGASRARWKFVAYHHPAYSSAPNRDNRKLRDAWLPIFDRHGVDLALQGHDHAYLRTHPMRGGQRVASTAEGTTYVVSVSGTKFYSQAERPETAVGFTNVATWQVLDLRVEGDRLTYRAYDRRGQVRDEFVIDKSASRRPGTP